MAEFIENPEAATAPAPQAQQPEMIPAGEGPLPIQEDRLPQGQTAGVGYNRVNPLTEADEEASPEEQQQYEDLFTRAMSMIHDTTEAPNGLSPADAVIEQLADGRYEDGEPHQVIGNTAATFLIQLIDMAKRNNVEYDGRVVQEVGMDVIVELIEIADVSGAIKGLPQEDSPEYDQLLELAGLEAAKTYGTWLQQTGQANQQEHKQYLEEQMEREADQGELDDWNMEEFDPIMRGQLARQYGRGFTDGS